MKRGEISLFVLVFILLSCVFISAAAKDWNGDEKIDESDDSYIYGYHLDYFVALSKPEQDKIINGQKNLEGFVMGVLDSLKKPEDVDKFFNTWLKKEDNVNILSDGVKNKIWEFIDSGSSEFNKRNEHLSNMMKSKVEGFSGLDFGKNIKGLKWKGNKIGSVGENGELASWIDLDDIPPWTKTLDYKDGEFIWGLDTRNNGNVNRVVKLKSGSIDKKGNFDYIIRLEGGGELFAYKDKFFTINLLRGERGEISIDENNYISLLDGADLKINEDYYKQFTGKHSKWYKPETGGDEAAVINLNVAGDSPSNFIPILKLKNVIASTSDGEFYFSRRKFIKFFNHPEFYPALNNLDYSKEEPYVKVTSSYLKSGELDVSMVGNNYMGFIAKQSVNVDNLYTNGEGGLVESSFHEPRGKFIYFKNGNLGTSVEEGKTFVSGRANADVSVRNVVNNKDSNNKIEVQGTKENTKVLVKDSNTGDTRTTYSYNGNNPSNKIWQNDVAITGTNKPISNYYQRPKSLMQRRITRVSYQNWWNRF